MIAFRSSRAPAWPCSELADGELLNESVDSATAVETTAGEGVVAVTGRVRIRIWVELIVGSAAGLLAVVTLFWRDWIEIVFGFDPDHDNGSVELLIVFCLFVVAIVLGVTAKWERRRGFARVAGRMSDEVSS